MKIQSVEEGVNRLKALSKKIDDLIATEEAMLPECAQLHVITDKDTLNKHVSEGRYIKFGLILYGECLPETAY